MNESKIGLAKGKKSKTLCWRDGGYTGLDSFCLFAFIGEAIVKPALGLNLAEAFIFYSFASTRKLLDKRTEPGFKL